MRRHRLLLVALCALAALAVGAPPVGAAVGAASEQPKDTEVGVSASTITIAVVADVDNSIVPGLFKGAVDGVKGAAAYINKTGGIAGRKLEVDFIDSKLNPNETRNAIITACSQDLAMVGTSAALFTGLEDLVGCKDKAGAATGIPDIGAIVLGTNEACSPVTFPVAPAQIDCTTAGQSPQTYRANQGPYKYLLKKHKSLAGPYIQTSDSTDAARTTTVLQKTAQHAGIKITSSPFLTNSAPQNAYTTIVNQMKQAGSTYADNGLAVNGAILFRQEAALQGLTDPNLVWHCSSACYDQKAMAAAGSVMDNEYMDLTFLPFAETKSNKTLASFIKYVGKDNANAYAVYGFVATLAFKQAVDDVVAKSGTNSLTRAALLTGLKGLTSFNAGGMFGTVNIGEKVPTSCFATIQWKSGAFTRAYPTKKGTFDCKASNLYSLTEDLTKVGP